MEILILVGLLVMVADAIEYCNEHNIEVEE